MKHSILCLLLLFAFCHTVVYGQKSKTFSLKSPDKKTELRVEAGRQLKWSVVHGNQQVIAPSVISMQLAGGEVLGDDGKPVSAKTDKVNTTIKPLHYKKDLIEDEYSQLTLNFKGNYGVIFRAYNDGVAYRFFTNKKDSLTVEDEVAEFNFPKDYMVYLPYANNEFENGAYDMYQISFENTYAHVPLSEVVKDTVAFAPVLVELNNGVKAAITEADLESYPGMFLQSSDKDFSLKGDFANYPLVEVQGGHNNLQSFIEKRAPYIAKTAGARKFPWRVVIISEQDKDLLNNDMVYKLASPSRIKDTSWIKPGKVAWDWWNDWNITGVDFRAGINTETYKYYIDFAAANNIENILLDEGWAESEDIMQVVPEIDLQEIIDYAASKNVGVWLWGGWLPLNRKTDEALSTYSKMGVKGFKIDFMDRDDQKMVDFYYKIADKAADYKLMVDFHGAYKPTGLQRTYPNVLNFEGVQGLEHAKWSDPDFPKYDSTIPFIRMLAGPLDYTPGAMKNANKKSFRAIRSAPMSQGTRTHQLALYVLYEAPFNMLADSPTNYMEEPESTEFIASVPTTFDETVALDGKVGKYAAVARRKGDTWYVGAITNWDERDLNIDLSFLPKGNYEAVIFKDGINADRNGTDYVREVIKVNAGDKLKVHMKGGGGWAARIYPAK
ncbi:glycoside hydrolase family 97 protein [Pontibacter sp. 172403-2]|uniref:glycoside hydrolase family 97 protein n=1 Tax=Pontibacter rufus TaxID=2791028 RepID=UPI0018AF8E6F|nr:glycoside hydrolase family 97 protein [Pontibacter sp. 172403-2]MBF9255702.1 glycoside hydrolase family 97 protein [Pontibacter sp. 172403-2]